MARSWRRLLHLPARRADGAGVGASEPLLGSGCQQGEQTGMATMSLLIATHQKVDTTVSSGFPGAPVSGVCVKGKRWAIFTFIHLEGELGLTLFVVS